MKLSDHYRQEGYKEGLIKGRAEGIEENKKKNALKLIEMGAGNPFIAQALELSEEEVKVLRKQTP